MNPITPGQWPQHEQLAEPLEPVRAQFGKAQGTAPVVDIAHTQDPVEAITAASQALNASQPAASAEPLQIDLTTLQTALAGLDDDRLLMVLVQLPTYQLARALECLLKPVGDASCVPQAQSVAVSPVQSESASADNRGADRAKVLRAGKIIYNNKMSVSDCSIRDLSSSGCRVFLESIAGIPDQFSLHILTGDSRHECEVAWRRSNMMGLRFIG